MTGSSLQPVPISAIEGKRGGSRNLNCDPPRSRINREGPGSLVVGGGWWGGLGGGKGFQTNLGRKLNELTIQHMDHKLHRKVSFYGRKDQPRGKKGRNPKERRLETEERLRL